MQKTNREAATLLCVSVLRYARTALLGVAIPLGPVVAQIKKQPTSAAASVEQRTEVGRAVVGHVFGDTAQHFVRVLKFDAKSEAANVYLSSPKNLLVIAVVPGREIEVIYPGDMTLGQSRGNTFAFRMQRYELTTSRGEGSAISAKDRQAFENCQRDRAARMRQNEINSRAKKDSTGKSVSTGAAAVSGHSVEPCEMPTGETAGKLTRRQLPARAEAERYLMVVTSSKAVSLADLEERLAGLTAVAPDVGLTIEAIAAGIFAGRPGTYGGTWTAW